MAQQIKLAEQAQSAIKAQHAPTAKQAERAVQASRAIHLDELKYLRKHNPKVETFLANYNDPTELNSFIDALTNRAAVSKKFGEGWGTFSTVSGTAATLAYIGAAIAAIIPGGQPVAAALATTGAIASVPAIPAALDVTIEKGIKPILAGKPKEAFLNTLMNLGETLDVAANPIKGLILEGGEGFVKGQGLFSSEGRVNYDYDTGSTVADIALEIITDPLTYLDLGLASASKAVAKAGVKQSAKSLTDIVVNSAADLGVKVEQDTLDTAVSKTLTKFAQEYSRVPEKTLTKEKKQTYATTLRTQVYQTIVRTLQKSNPNLSATKIDQLLRTMKRKAKNKKLAQTVANKIENNVTLDMVTNQVLRSISNAQRYSNMGQRALFKGALYTSGFGLGFEVLKQGWNAVKSWQTKAILRSLTKPKYFDMQRGLDISRWEETKEAWAQQENYFTMVGQQAAPMDNATLMSMLNSQLSRDQAMISLVLQNKSTALKKSAALDAKFTELYGYDFNQYILYLERLNAVENDAIKQYVKFAKDIKKLVENLAINKEATHAFRVNPKGDAQFIAELAKIKGSNVSASAKTFYRLQSNIENVTETLMYNATFNTALLRIAKDPEGAGAFIRNVLRDPNAYVANASAEFVERIKRVKSAIDNINAIHKFYDEVDAMPLPEIKGISSTDFKRYFRDEIFGFEETVDELLANFDDYTMPVLMQKLEALLYDKKFKVTNYSGLQDLIAPYFKSFLENMQKINAVETLKNTLPEDFVSNVQFIRDYLNKNKLSTPDVDKVFGTLSTQTAVLKSTRAENLYLKEFIVDSSIFKKYGKKRSLTRELSDAGYALRTIGTKEDLALFENIKNMHAEVFERTLETGRYIRNLKERFEQFEIFEKLTAAEIKQINALYTEFSKKYLKKVTNPRLQQFKHLKKNITDVKEQLAILTEFTKALKTDADLGKEFYLFAGTFISSRSLWNLIMHPELTLKTTFAMDGMKFNKWIAQQALREEYINMNNAWRALGKMPGKLANDFGNLRAQLSNTGLDRAKAVQLERYQKKLMEIEKFYDNLENEFAKLYEPEVAIEQIEKLRDFINLHPDFEKYSGLVDKLERYWNHTEEFKQPAKYQNTEAYANRKQELTERYIKLGLTSEQVDTAVNNMLKEEFPDGTVDEFTVFWNEIQDMVHEMNLVLDKEHADIVTKAKEDLKEQRKEVWQKVHDDFEYIYKTDETPTEQTFDWEHPHITTKPYEESEVYDKEHMQVDPSNVYYNDKTNSYRWYSTERYKHGAYLKSRQQYHDDWTAYHKAITALEKKLESTTDIDTIIRDMCSTKENGIAVDFDDALYKRITQALKDIESRYADDIQIAKDWARGSAWKESYQKSVAEFYAQFNAEDQKLLSKIEHASSFKQAWWYTHNLNFSAEAKKTLNIKKEYTHRNVFKDFQDLESDAKFEKFKELFEQKIVPELRDKLGQRNTKMINKLVEPIDKQLYETWKASLPKEAFLDITPWDPFRKQQEFYKMVTVASNQNAKSSLRSIFNQTPEEFIQDLALSHGVMTFLESDISEKDLRRFFTKIYRTVDKNLVHFEKDGERWWIVLDKKQSLKFDGRQVYLNSNAIMHKAKPKTFDEFNAIDEKFKNIGLTKQLNKMNSDLEELTGTPLRYSQGESFDAETAKKLYSLMPENVQKLVDEKAFTDANNYKYFHYNNTILGTAKSKADLSMFFGGNMIVNMRNAYIQSAGYVKAKTEYVHTVFDSMLSINSPNSIWKDYSDEALLEALQQNPDYALVTMTEHKKYGLKVVELPPLNIDVIKKAREYGATIVPRQVAKDMYNVVNHRLGSTGFAKLWNRIIYLFKFGYLIRPGAWIRNFIDTNIKSQLEMGSERQSYMNQAHIILDEFERIKDFAAKRSDNSDGLITNEAIKEYFTIGLNKNLTYEQFQELNQKVFQQGIAQNIMADLYKGEGGEFWQSITYYTGKIIDSANKTEHYNRLATYLYYLDHGYDNTAALSKLAKVHFDYRFKTEAEQLAEMVFPFTTFTIRNLSYWVEMAEKHPWIMRNYIHLMKPSWDFQDYTPQELAIQRRVQNQIIYGQLKLGEFNGKVATFKANPSIQDALQMFSDPINNIYDKLTAPISEPLETMQMGQLTASNAINMIPAVGPTINDVRQAVQSGSPVPSAIGIYKTPKHTGQTYRSRYSLSATDQYTDATYRTPKYRNNYNYDHYRTYGATRYRNNFYPIVDIAHEIKMRYSINVYNRIKNRIHKDPQNIIRWRIRQDANRFRSA